MPVPAGSAVVIGGGIVGIASAINLIRLGRSVVLVDRGDPPAAASWGNGGVLARCAVVPVPVPGIVRRIPTLLRAPDSPLFVNWAYLPRMAGWLRRYLGNASAARVRHAAAHLHPLLHDSVAQHRALAGDSPAAAHIQDSPYLFIYPDAAARAAEAFTWEVRRAHGYEPEVVDGRRLLELAGPFAAKAARGAVGLLLPDHGRIDDPGAYLTALHEAFAAAGGTVVKAAMTALDTVEDHVTVTAGHDRIEAATAVLAAGAWSAPFVRRLGCRVGMESERGYHLELAGVPAPSCPVMDAGRKVVATPMPGRVRLSGIVDFGGVHNPPNAKATAMLARYARQVYPDAQPAQPAWMGHRPAPWDSLPLLGPTPASPRVIIATGTHHVGMTMGAKLGKLAAQLACGIESDIPIGAYRPDRG